MVSKINISMLRFKKRTLKILNLIGSERKIQDKQRLSEHDKGYTPIEIVKLINQYTSNITNPEYNINPAYNIIPSANKYEYGHDLVNIPIQVITNKKYMKYIRTKLIEVASVSVAILEAVDELIDDID